MSYTIHSTPRNNLPRSEAQATIRAIAAIQDATTFQQARDALLRYYYPLLRGWLKKNNTDAQACQESEDWALSLTHSTGQSSGALFGQRVCSGNPSSACLEQLQHCIDTARKDKDKTPYERVGDVLAWLKNARALEPGLQWGHSALRQWMQGLLMDFTLVDAKNKPGALLSNPEKHYDAMVEQWSQERTGVPFNQVWYLRGQQWFTEQSIQKSFTIANDGILESKALALRSSILQHHPAAALLLVHSDMGIVREFRPTWRDVTDYGVLHPLMTLDESSFNKDIWLDFLQHKGHLWSKPQYEATWYEWQEKASLSYTTMIQAYAGSTLHAITRGTTPTQNNSAGYQIELDARLPVALDWYKVLTQLASRFPYLNESPQLQELMSQKLSNKQQEQFVLESKERVGQPLIHALLNLPEELQSSDALNMPAWFHVHLQAMLAQNNSLALPDGLVDDSQTPSLY